MFTQNCNISLLVGTLIATEIYFNWAEKTFLVSGLKGPGAGPRWTLGHKVLGYLRPSENNLTLFAGTLFQRKIKNYFPIIVFVNNRALLHSWISFKSELQEIFTREVLDFYYMI